MPDMDDAILCLDFRPHTELVTSARQFVSDFYARVLSDPDLASQLALATHELLENVIKYSTDGRGRFKIELVRTGETRVVRIVAANKTSPERARELRRRLDELSSAPDPLVYYQELMRKTAMRTDPSAGLGLARIRAEGDMDVSFCATDDVVSITAELSLPRSEISP
ncbi:MAG: DUF6272 family protein [Polyangiaceae bacterium]|jgi:anti-sigma regulatory factor (Ser/Thr protein kinase)